MPRQNPTVPVADYAAMAPPMSAVPRLGESRAMPGRKVQALMGQLFHPDLEQLYLGQRIHAASAIATCWRKFPR